jgi:hypothetical protein
MVCDESDDDGAEYLRRFVLIGPDRLPTRHPNVSDKHAEPKHKDDERRRQLKQTAENPRDRSVGPGGADDYYVVGNYYERDGE